MLHIATVHFRSARWIPIQARELHRHLTVPYRTWSCLDGIEPSYGKYFDRVYDRSGHHAEKLNHLASEIVAEAADDDLLMFLDGDAFPIADPQPLIAAGLSEAPLLAVRRAENFDDPQPHPCFCVTDVVTWRSLPGDWREGMTWPGPGGRQITDVGAGLLQQLQLTDTPWTQVLRSNQHDLHPLFFGIYGDVIYHHGAGFRLPHSRADLAILAAAGGPSGPSAAREMLTRNHREAEAVFERIQRDDSGWLDELR